MVGKRTFHRDGGKDDDEPRHNDLETGRPNRRFGGFRDAVEYVIDRKTTAALKQQLKDGVQKDNDFENFRKSDEEVGSRALPMF
jgi:hypothetical protein